VCPIHRLIDAVAQRDQEIMSLSSAIEWRRFLNCALHCLYQKGSACPLSQQIKIGGLAKVLIKFSVLPFLFLRFMRMGQIYSPGSISASSERYFLRYSSGSGICVEKDEDVSVDVLDTYSSSNGGAQLRACHLCCIRFNFNH
jgi:hypothetical protein